MQRFAMRVGGIIGALLLLGPAVRDAAALDLTGTWTGTGAAICHGLVAGILPDKAGSDITLKISPTTPGYNVCINLPRADLSSTLNGAHQYHSTFFPKSAKSHTAYGTLTESGTAISSSDLSGAVGSFTSSFDKTANAQELKGTLLSGDGTSAVACTFKNVSQTSTTDPGTTCP